MNLRPFGTTGMQVSEIGLGAWQLANPSWGMDDKQEALRIVQQSLAAGCNFFDTAPGYGNGVSEDLLGQGLASARKDVIICTKFGYSPEGVQNFSTENIRPILEGSLRRLRTDYVDILLLHNPARELMDGRSATQYAELERLKQEGKIREYGVSLDWKIELETVIETTNSNAIELMYNVFYQEPRDAFTMAQERGAGLIIKVPLDSGWLSWRQPLHRCARALVARGDRAPRRLARTVRGAGAAGRIAGARRTSIYPGASGDLHDRSWREDGGAGAR